MDNTNSGACVAFTKRRVVDARAIDSSYSNPGKEPDDDKVGIQPLGASVVVLNEGLPTVFGGRLIRPEYHLSKSSRSFCWHLALCAGTHAAAGDLYVHIPRFPNFLIEYS